MRPATPRPAYSTRKLRGWQEQVFVGLLLLGLTWVFFWPQVGQGRVLYWGDSGLYFLPMTVFLRQSLLAGHLPLWNPLLLCGTPFVGNPQTWPAYPLSWLLPLMPAGQFLSFTVAFHVWLAAWGTWVFLRRAEGLSGQAALVGALVFGLGGQLVSKEQFPNMVQAIAWLPLILWAVHGVLTHGRAADTVRLGLFLGLQLLAAHAQMTLLTLYVAVAYGLRVWLPLPPPLRPKARALAGHLFLSAMIAAGLCTVQVLPTVELYASAWRQRLPFAAVDRFTLPLNELGNFALPHLHGSPFAGNFSARGNVWETCCYLSVVGAGLAAAGIGGAWRVPECRPMRFWAVLALAGLWMALGGKAGLYHLAYWTLPGFRSFHDPARCLLWSAWALSMLAAGGWERVQRFVPKSVPREGAFAVCALLIFADLTHFARTLYPLTSPAALAQALPAPLPAADAAAFAAHQARVLSPDTTRVWQRFTRYQTFRQDVPNYLPLWMQTRTPNLPMLRGAMQASGYEPVARRDAQTLVSKTTDALGPKATASARAGGMALAGMLGVRTVTFCRVGSPQTTLPGAQLLQTFGTLPPPPGKPADGVRVFVCRNTFWQPRARLTAHFVVVSTHAGALALLGRAAQNPALLNLATTTVLVGQPGFVPAGRADAGPVLIAADAPDRVVVQANNSKPAMLVLADTLHPGWHARVDGHAVPILSADGFLRAVALRAAGPHRVVFVYRPVSFLLGCYVSLMTLASLCAFFVCAAGVSRHRRE